MSEVTVTETGGVAPKEAEPWELRKHLRYKVAKGEEEDLTVEWLRAIGTRFGFRKQKDKDWNAEHVLNKLTGLINVDQEATDSAEWQLRQDAE